MSESLTGQKLGAYRVGELIGEGAMGEVYRGVHEELGRRVAIKTLKRSLRVDAELMKRFFDEAKAVNIIHHENIVECTDMVHDPNGQSYIVMELLEGRTLGAAIREGRLARRDAVHIAVQIADAIGAAHEKDIIHRDLKPENVFLIERAGRSDYVKVLDFGIARLQGASATKAGALLGTPAYMSPEQANGDRAGPASDIYALGVILFQLCTGRLPFQADTLNEMLAAHLSRTPPRADTFAADVPAALADAIEEALAKQPGHRQASMRQLRTQLLQAVGLPVRAGAAVGPRGKRAQPQLALAETSAPGQADALTQAPSSRPGVGTTSLSGAAAESRERIPATKVSGRRLARRRMIVAAVLFVVAGVGARLAWQWTRAAAAATLDDLLLVGCETAPGDALTCQVEVAPELADDPEARPWIAYVNLEPRDGVELRDERGCGRVATFTIKTGEEVQTITRFVVTDCLLAARAAHGYRTRLTATRNGVTRPAELLLAVATPVAQLKQGYETLMSYRSYSLADVWFVDAEKRAEEALGATPPDPEAPQTLVRAIYYRAYTRYMRLADCAMRHRVEGRPCARGADMDRWYDEAVKILDDNLNHALRRSTIPTRQRQRQEFDRARLSNDLVLRFSKGAIAPGSSVHRAIKVVSGQCTDFAQQSRVYQALIAVAAGGREAEAMEHLTAIVKNLTELPSCEPLEADRAALARSVHAVLLYEYGLCAGPPVLKDVTSLVCAVVREYPELTASAEVAAACADAPHGRDEDLSRAIRLLVINMRRRNAGLDWRGGCHQKRLAARAAAGVTGTPMAAEPTGLVIGAAPADAGDTAWHYVIDAQGRVYERRPVTLEGAFPGASCGAQRHLGIAVAPGSALADAVRDELIDELRARYGIPAERVYTAANPARCDF